jgi:hypothetical protein
VETTLRRIGDTLGALVDALTSAWAAGAWRPETWPPTMWILLGALVVLILLAAVRRRRPPPLEVRPPQLLITQGEIIPDTPADAAPRRRRRGIDPSAAAAGSLTMTVSNLSRYPVQLLEVAVREESRGAPRVAEVDAVVPAMGSVDVAVRVPLALRGDGWIDVYCYAAAPRHKVHRHRAELVWEPWAARFKVAPMEQVASPVRQLASEDRKARFELAEPPAPEVVRQDVPPAAAAPVVDRVARGGDRGVTRAVGERPTAVSRVAPTAPVAAEAWGDGGAEEATGFEHREAASLGALWDRLPEGEPAARASRSDQPGEAAGPLARLEPAAAETSAPVKPPRVASSSISPASRAPRSDEESAVPTSLGAVGGASAAHPRGATPGGAPAPGNGQDDAPSAPAAPSSHPRRSEPPLPPAASPPAVSQPAPLPPAAPSPGAPSPVAAPPAAPTPRPGPGSAGRPVVACGDAQVVRTVVDGGVVAAARPPAPASGRRRRRRPSGRPAPAPPASVPSSGGPSGVAPRTPPLPESRRATATPAPPTATPAPPTATPAPPTRRRPRRRRPRRSARVRCRRRRRRPRRRARRHRRRRPRRRTRLRPRRRRWHHRLRPLGPRRRRPAAVRGWSSPTSSEPGRRLVGTPGEPGYGGGSQPAGTLRT